MSQGTLGKMSVKQLNAKILTTYWLHQLDYSGCNPNNQSIYKKLLRCVYIICVNTLIILMTFNAFFNEYESIGHVVEILIVNLGVIQMSTKLITLTVKGKRLSQMLNIVWNEFWPLSSVEEYSQKKLLKICKFVNMVAKIYKVNIIAAITFYLLGAVLMEHNEKTLPMNIWMPYKNSILITPFFEMLFALELIVLYSAAFFCLIPMDALFVLFIGLAYCQFKMIKEKLLNVGNSDDPEYDYLLLQLCVAHHNLLISFMNMFDDVYSNSILPIIGSHLCLSGLSIYATVLEPSASRRIMLAVVCAAVFIQLFFYCQAGQIILDEAASVANAAYNCNWTNIRERKVKMGLQLIIIRAQKPVNITVGGFIILSMEMFTRILRSSMSLYTFMENMKS